ncbi:ABC transporter permease [Flexilinea flocculi]|jgi:putative ABC transport system permease protein|uniref:ABC-type transport system n=1 Tax=Flexilinea flocculi TaxID=1678840 RepID=A0A0S7BSN0_9CHLR|nr:ABC transporter permease [Flexilinea flocculi]GAP40465.1 ABC-type transport system [Flexilinea flocculi]
MKKMSIAAYLAVKEIWKFRGRFLLVSLVIGLITLLVLFIAALGEGLGNGNREYLSKLDGELIVYQAKSDFLIPASRLDLNRFSEIKNVEGISDVGLLGTANSQLLLSGDDNFLKTALLGVEPGHVGEPKVIEGSQLSAADADEVILDRNVILRSNIQLGDTITIRVTQGTEDQVFTLKVVGITDGQQYALQPSLFVPFFTWDRIRPKSQAEINFSDPVANVFIVKVDQPENVEIIRDRIEEKIENVETATRKEAIQALPGYSAQQSTLNTQGGFTLFIGILVIGGFFQIQVLQKISQIGVLKAIGSANSVVAWASIIQITLITMIGVAIGAGLTFLFSLFFPPQVPIVFNGTTTAIAIIALLLIGPLGGLVSIRYAVRIEPLKALGLSS